MNEDDIDITTISDFSEKLTSTWNLLTRGLHQEDVTKALESAINSITSEELTAEGLQDALNMPCPLAALVKPLLDNIKRYEPWDSLMEEIYDDEYFGTPWSRKIFLTPLIQYLPLLSSRSLVEHISEMNTPIPLAFPVPKPPLTQPYYTIPFSSLRSVITPGIPFIFSCGTNDSVGNGKSTFLNTAFQTNFEVNADDIFHFNSVDISLDRLMMPLPFNVIDCHGVVPTPILQLLSSICRICLIHVMPSDIAGDCQGIRQLIKLFLHMDVIIILIRDATDELSNDISKLQEFVKNKVWEKITIRVIEIPKIKDGQQFITRFRRTLKQKFIPCLKLPRFTESHYTVEFYEDLEGRLSNAFEWNEHLYSMIDLRVCCDKVVMMRNDIKKELANTEESVAKEGSDFIHAVFPLSNLKTEIEKENLKLLTTVIENESQNEREKRETEIQVNINNLLGRMAAMQNGKFKTLINMFIRYTVSDNNIEMMDEISYIIADFGLYAFGGEDSKPVRPKRDNPLPISMDNFWRETLLIKQYTDDISRDRNIYDDIRNLGQSILLHGRPLEILNGDSLSMDTKFLGDVLKCAGNDNLVVCSVLGPQSSHKSTLLNYLFGSGFEVGAGRCTKGLYASLFKTEYKGAENLLVLDTEGLLSIEKSDPLFDKRMALLALSLSHIVLINVKGEMGSEMKNILEVTILGLKRLRVQFPQPKIFFILRDMIDLNIGKQTQAIQSILKDIRNVAKKMEFELLINEDSFILLPSALSQKSQDNLFTDQATSHDNVSNCKDSYERNVVFSKSIKELKKRILNETVTELEDRNLEQLPFKDTTQWIAHAKRVWDSVQLFGDLLNFNTLREYYDRDDLGRITQEIVKEILEKQFMVEASAKMDDILAIVKNDNVIQTVTIDALNKKQDIFIDFLKNDLKVRYDQKLQESFVARVKDLRIADSLKAEYKEALKKSLEKMYQTVEREFSNQKGFGIVYIEIQKAIRHITKWIDTTILNSTADETTSKLKEHFEKEWESTKNHIPGRLIELQLQQEDIDRNLRNDFQSVIRSIPSLTIVNNQLGATETQSRVKEIQECLNPATFDPESKWFDSMKNNYMTRVAIIGIFSNSDIKTHCRFMFQKIRELFSDIRNHNKALWNSSTTQGVIIRLDNIIKDVDDKHLRRCGWNFNPLFYGTCQACLFMLLREIFKEQTQKNVMEHLNIFENHKDNLCKAFIRLVKERYDDKKTSSTIAAFFMGAISESITTEVDEKLQRRLKDVIKMSAQLLINKCEEAQSSEDIFDYITNTPMFMQKIFDANFDNVYKELIDTVFQGEYQSGIETKLRLLYDELKEWKSWWLDATEYLERIWINDQIDNKKIASAIYTSFVNHLKKKAPQPDCGLRQLDVNLSNYILGSRKRISATDFTFLFSAIPEAHAIKDPNLFINELRKELDSMKKKFTNFKPDHGNVERTRNALWEDAAGCQKRCPHCLAKCSESLAGHSKHQTSHRMTAFAGCRYKDMRHFDFNICDSVESQRIKWAKGDDIYRPFNEYMAKHHPDWFIPIKNNSQILITNKIRWIQIREKMCKLYDLDDNTPSDWFELLKTTCPACHQVWGESCGKKIKTSCGHDIGAICLSKLMGKVEVERKCPKCAILLPLPTGP